MRTHPPTRTDVCIVALGALVFGFIPGCPMRAPEPPVLSSLTDKRRPKNAIRIPLATQPADCLEESVRGTLRFPAGRDAVFYDVDGDGFDEIIIATFDGVLLVLDRDGDRRERINLRRGRTPGLPDMDSMVHSVTPARIGGEVRWLVAYRQFDSSENRGHDSLRFELFSHSGQPLWSYEPTLPEGTSCEAHAVAGRLRLGDDDQLVIALELRPDYDADNTDEMMNRAGHLLILDGAGSPICQKAFDEPIGTVCIARPHEPGQPAAIVCIVGSSILRCQLEPQATTRPAASAPVSTAPASGR